MKVKLFPRAGGKTAFAIRESAHSQIPIVCFNHWAAMEVQQRAKKDGVSIPKPTTISQLMALGDPPPKVIIDNLDKCLSSLLPNTETVMATITDN